MNFCKLILYLFNFLTYSDNIPIKSNEKIKGIFKKLNNFKVINFLINRYIFKNNYSETIF